MNRNGHVALGAAIGVGSTALQPAPTLSGVLLAGWMTGAAALLPDLDHPNSTVTGRFGPVSKVLSLQLRWLSALLYKLTKGPQDEPVRGTHRHATHTLAFAGLTGWGVTAGCQAAGEHHLWAGVAAVLVVLAILVDLAVTFFGWWMLLALGVLAGTIATSGQPVAEILHLAEPIGWYVALGCGAHCVGDAFTEQGCPMFWPIPIKGETFYEIRLPELLRITTGGAVEKILVGTFTTAAVGIGVGVLNPGLISYLLSLNGAAVFPVSLELLDSRSTLGQSRRTSEWQTPTDPGGASTRRNRNTAGCHGSRRVCGPSSATNSPSSPGSCRTLVRQRRSGSLSTRSCGWPRRGCWLTGMSWRVTRKRNSANRYFQSLSLNDKVGA